MSILFADYTSVFTSTGEDTGVFFSTGEDIVKHDLEKLYDC